MLDWLDFWDGAALAWFFVVWTAYTAYADHGPAHARSITAAMNARRRAWMMEAAKRDLRMIDTNILGNLLTGVGFFSSTTIFVIGGLIAMIGVADESAVALARLPLIEGANPAALEVKTAGLLVIFIYAFFKFAWAFRLANYCSITVGGMPSSADGESEHSRAHRRGGGHPVGPVRPPLQPGATGVLLRTGCLGLADRAGSFCRTDNRCGARYLPQRVPLQGPVRVA